MITNQFFEWLGGLIDADGGFYISKKGYGCIEITMHIKEIQTLYFIKKKCHGSVSLRAGAQAARWRLHRKQHLLYICSGLSGHIRTLNRQSQFIKICKTYNLHYKVPETLRYENAWFSGFFSGEGCLYINKNTFQCTISVSQKEKNILYSIQRIYKGNIFFDISWQGWVWQLSNKHYCNQVLDYFSKYSTQNPYKQAKIKSFKRFLIYKEKGYHLDPLKKEKLVHFIKVFEIKD